jgi:hypothetical protein
MFIYVDEKNRRYAVLASYDAHFLPDNLSSLEVEGRVQWYTEEDVAYYLELARQIREGAQKSIAAEGSRRALRAVWDKFNGRPAK